MVDIHGETYFCCVCSVLGDAEWPRLFLLWETKNKVCVTVIYKTTLPFFNIINTFNMSELYSSFCFWVAWFLKTERKNCAEHLDHKEDSHALYSSFETKQKLQWICSIMCFIVEIQLNLRQHHRNRTVFWKCWSYLNIHHSATHTVWWCKPNFSNC